MGTTLLVGFLVATLALAAWLAWEAVESARSHRQAAEEALTDYAGVAAWESARLATESLDRVLDDAFDDVPRRTRRSEPTALYAVAEDLHDAMRWAACACEGLRHPMALFRLDAEGGGELRPDGALGPADVAAVAEAVDAQRKAWIEDGPHGLVLTRLPSDPREVVVLFAVSQDRSGGDRGVYGLVASLDAFGELASGWFRGRTLLPPAIGGDTPQDSLLSVRVLSPSGAVVSAPADSAPSVYSARTPLAPRFGGLVVEASVLPAVADQLVIGGLPRSRLPLLLVLLLLTAGVGVAGLAELRRHQALARLREDFVSSVSHELRTPLTQIRMLAELLEEDKLRTAEERARSTRIIRREAQRLTVLVENILQFARSRAPAALAAPVTRAVEVEEVVREAASLLEAVAAHDTAAIDVRIDGAPHVVAQREGLRRIVGNLLDNAIKYGPPGQRVTVEVVTEGDVVRITVSDEGPGVPPGEREAVWTPYRRLTRDVEARHPGSGVGLAVVRELVTGYGGSVAIGDAPGGGACFSVTLPAAPGGREEGEPWPGS